MVSGRGASARKSDRMSKSKRAGLNFPVGRVGRYLKDGRFARRLGMSAPIYLAAVLEYLCAEVLELSGKAAKENNRKQITPRHIQLAIRKDDEFARLLGNVTISQGGVLPNIHPAMLTRKK